MRAGETMNSLNACFVCDSCIISCYPFLHDSLNISVFVGDRLGAVIQQLHAYGEIANMIISAHICII